MVKDKDIKQFMLRHKPEVNNSGPFMKEVVHRGRRHPFRHHDGHDSVRLDPFISAIFIPVQIRAIRAICLDYLYM